MTPGRADPRQRTCGPPRPQLLPRSPRILPTRREHRDGDSRHHPPPAAPGPVRAKSPAAQRLFAPTDAQGAPMEEVLDSSSVAIGPFRGMLLLTEVGPRIGVRQATPTARAQGPLDVRA